MTDIAHLTYDIDSSPASQAANDLDRMSAAGKRAEQAAAGVSGSTKRMGSAMADMLASIERSTRELVELTRQQRLVAQASDAVAASETRAAATARAATVANITYAHSFTQVVGDAGAAAAAIDKAGSAATRAAGQAKAAASHFDTMFDAANHNFATQYNAQMMSVVGAQTKGAAAAKLHGHELLNLSRQFADVGVTAAMGMNPLMILVQQGPQIGETLAMAAKRGVTFRAALLGIATAAAPLLAVLAPIGIVAGAVFGAAALGARQLNKDNDDLAAGLGLTEKQLKKLKDAGVETGVTIGDVFKGTFNYIRDSLAPSLAPLSQFFSDLFDKATTGAVNATKAIAGGFAGAFAYIKTIWANLPAVIGDAAISAANSLLRTIEKMINGAVDMINGLIAKANAAAGAVGLAARLPTLGAASTGQIDNPYAGQAAGTFQAADAAAKAAAKRAADGVDNILGGLGKAIVDAAKDRLKDAAGEASKDKAAKKGAAAPRDMSDERMSQIDAMLSQARAEELRAQLDLTRDIIARAQIEKEILGAQLETKQAQVDRQIANIDDDKGLTAASKALLTAQLEAVKLVNARVGALQEQKINEELARELTRQRFEVEAAGMGDQIDILSSQRDIARYGFERRDLDLKILKAQQDIERLKLQEVLATAASTSAEYKIADARLAILDVLHKNQTQAAVGTFQDNFHDASDAFGDLARALKSKDWESAATALIEAFGTLRKAMATGNVGGMIGGVAGIAGVASQFIGGKAGGALGGLASGAAAGAAFGPWGAAIGGIIGGIGGFFSSSKADKAAKNAAALKSAEEELARVREIAAQRADLEIGLLEARGQAEAALAARHKATLAAMDPSLRALQELVWAEEKLAEARQKAVEVAQSGVDDARARLTEAYDAEAGALQATIDKFTAFSDSLKKFRDSLYSGPAAMLSPEEQYKAARAAFDSTSALAAGGDENAIRDLESVSQAYLDASKDYYASSKDYFADLDRVRAAVTATQAYAASQVDVGQAQLTALNASVAGILNINNSVLSVRDALAGYQSAIQALAAAQAAAQVANDNAAGGGAAKGADWSSYMASNSDVAAEYLRNMASAKGRDYLAQIGATSAEAFGQWHWNNNGKAEGRTPYAAGGIMDRPITLGESGIGAEAGAEGILPLANVGGKMGVHAVSPDNGEEKALLRELIAKQDDIIAELRADKAQRAAMAEEQQKQSKRVEDQLARQSRTKAAA